ncbi:MAG: chalcone isomerase family protein [Deltaproteobacteria bacterium]|nr:chalcone isomerase family protein [Deltaproteobacteria bacterium]
MLSWPVYAAEIEGVQFADSYRADTVTMKLSCTGLLRYMYVIKGYVAALYVGDGVQTGDVLADVPKRLELNYFYAIKGEDFGKAGDKILADNIDAETFNRLRPRLQKLNSLYEDVKPGDRYSLTYVPGKGTELALNGKPKGVIEGADFAAAYFAIWLGRRPIDESLRAQLLHCPRA